MRIGRIAAACAILAALSATSPTRPGQVLIGQLHALADSGRMTDAAFVARTLGVTFAPAEDRAFDPTPVRCAAGLTARPWRTVRRQPDAATALRPTPFGRANVTVPAFAINAGGEVSGDPVLTYTVSTQHDCTGYVALGTETTAGISIGPMSTFDCVTPAELRRWLPAATEMQATDGAIVWAYDNPRTGAQITFDFFAFTPCMLAIAVTDEPRLSPRYQAAQQRQKACMLPYEAAFCRRHSPFGWGDGDVQGAMDAEAEAKCGSLDSFLAHTPANARPVRAIGGAPADPARSTPCSRIEAALAARR